MRGGGGVGEEERDASPQVRAALRGCFRILPLRPARYSAETQYFISFVNTTGIISLELYSSFVVTSWNLWNIQNTIHIC